ncbi:MAG: PPOX class F420-dependent oxidoreductase [Halieaceae bacterium]|jgi:uncharacterized protein|nr:PPOX class F420-dependent oxidoreductase [Halieaceae bacterium]
MPENDLEFLEGGNYISFATRKKSGDYVATPVWFAPHEGSYYLFSAGGAGKIKRLRNFAQSRIAACTVRGVVIGDWVETESHVLDQQKDIDTALQALHHKYGWQMMIADISSRLTGKMARRAYIRVDLNTN